MTTAPPRQGEMSAVPEAQLRAAAEAVLVVADGVVAILRKSTLSSSIGAGAFLAGPFPADRID